MKRNQILIPRFCRADLGSIFILVWRILRKLPTNFSANFSANFPCEFVRPCFSMFSRAANGGFQTGGFPNLGSSVPICPILSFLGLSRFVRIFLFFGGLSRIVLSSSPGLLQGTVPDRVRDTIRTFLGFLEKIGNPRFWKPSGLASLKASGSPPKLHPKWLAFLQPPQKNEI